MASVELVGWTVETVSVNVDDVLEYVVFSAVEAFVGKIGVPEVSRESDAFAVRPCVAAGTV